ncbi:MAG: ribosome biogenesis GTPase Der [Acidobacteriota bacterium]
MKNIPVITIIGVPNTGKSTFFNRIIGKRRALIHSEPGMTRDIFKESFELNNKTFFIQDTGGFFPDENLISNEVNKRIFSEVKRSDLILFLFSGRRDLLGYEKELYLEVKKLNNRIIPVMNKVDNPGKFILPDSYYSLKLDFVQISAEHNIGIEDVLEVIDNKFSDIKTGIIDHEHPVMRISIMGKPNVGKSSIINTILNDEMAIVSPLPGTTRDSVNFEVKRKGKKFVLVDNAGIRKLKKVKESTESAAVIRAEKDLSNADIIIFVIDISKKIDQTDLLLAKKILNSAKPVIIACNKWDLIKEKSDSDNILNKIKRTLHAFYFSPFIIVSAKTGKNIFNLIDTGDQINHILNTKISTSHLNKVIREILNEKKLLTDKNIRFNPKYMSIESYKPFFLHFHSFSSRLKSFDEKYLKKRVFEKLELTGIPVFFKTSPNKKKN